jgi:hypothetical protein
VNILNSDGTLNRQEAFNRAWNGLASQGWTTAHKQTILGVACTYLTEDGRRCAWGWVDPEGTSLGASSVPGDDITDLRRLGYGIAKNLNDYDVEFAKMLQAAHDNVAFGTAKPANLEESMRYFATGHGLTVPE